MAVEKSGNPKVKVAFFATGVESMGMKTSVASERGTEVEMIAVGIKATNKAGKVVVVPFANIKCLELLP